MFEVAVLPCRPLESAQQLCSAGDAVTSRASWSPVATGSVSNVVERLQYLFAMAPVRQALLRGA